MNLHVKRVIKTITQKRQRFFSLEKFPFQNSYPMATQFGDNPPGQEAEEAKEDSAVLLQQAGVTI